MQLRVDPAPFTAHGALDVDPNAAMVYGVELSSQVAERFLRGGKVDLYGEVRHQVAARRIRSATSSAVRPVASLKIAAPLTPMSPAAASNFHRASAKSM